MHTVRSTIEGSLTVGRQGRHDDRRLLDLPDRIRDLILEKRRSSAIKKRGAPEDDANLAESVVERGHDHVTTLREINTVIVVA
jgi:hypothetical protein